MQPAERQDFLCHVTDSMFNQWMHSFLQTNNVGEEVGSEGPDKA